LSAGRRRRDQEGEAIPPGSGGGPGTEATSGGGAGPFAARAGRLAGPEQGRLAVPVGAVAGGLVRAVRRPPGLRAGRQTGGRQGHAPKGVGERHVGRAAGVCPEGAVGRARPWGEVSCRRELTTSASAAW